MLRCLIVEDNPLNWMILKKQAEQMGLQVDVATNGQEALDYCHNNPLPQLIVLDGYMPEMDGVTFMKLLRKLPDGDKPYIIF